MPSKHVITDTCKTTILQVCFMGFVCEAGGDGGGGGGLGVLLH